MSQPFDLDAAVGEQVGEPFPFTWGGQKFTVEPLLLRDIEVQLRLIDAIEGIQSTGVGDDPEALLGILKLIVGDDLLEQMRKARPVGGAALMALVRAWTAHEGVSLGKSQDSSESSASTARPSKRTSRSARARKTS